MSPRINRREMLAAAIAAGLAPSFAPAAPAGRHRLRDLGLKLGMLPTGRFNAITDVRGVAVGHTTLLSGAPPLVVGKGPIRTGVTAILPRGRLDSGPCRAGAAALNGNGEMTGVLAVRRSGLLRAPIFLTGTGNIGIVYQSAVRLMATTRTSPPAPPVVCECWDALGDIRGRHLREEHVRQAVESAKSGPVAEGAVGGGTGMTCYDFKGGVGTASRVVSAEHGGFTVGVLVNANHGSRKQLTIAGLPIGQSLADYPSERKRPSSSIILVVGTDAPLERRQLERLALRLAMGLARTGATATTSSGDLLFAFSTAPIDAPVLEDEHISPLYQAVVESAEEAVLNALAMAVDVVGADGELAPALPLDRVTAMLRLHGLLR